MSEMSDESDMVEASGNNVPTWTQFCISDMDPEMIDDCPTSRLEWLRQKKEDQEANPILDKLMTMVGLEEVKSFFLAVKSRVKLVPHLRAGHSRADLFEGFEGFEGFDQIVSSFTGYHDLVKGMRKHDIRPEPHIPWAFFFSGPPGTGKTSTARKIGQLYDGLTLLSSAEVVVCSVTDLVGGYHEQTGPRVINLLESALGKVLFIDEAYRLAENRNAIFHREAIGELVDAMTQPRYAQKMVIILAGYTKEMEVLLKANTGLRSRFPEHFKFAVMRPKICLKHLSNKIEEQNIKLLPPEADAVPKTKKIYRLFRKLGKTGGWANGRDVETLAKSIVGAVYMKEGREEKTNDLQTLFVTADELTLHLQRFLRERKRIQEDEQEE